MVQWAKTTLLHIEADPLWRDRVQDMLSSWPDYLHEGSAITGKEGIGLCTRVAPDLVLLDLRLPDMHGLEVAEALNRLRRRPRVLLISAMHDEATLFRAGRSLVDGFIRKTSNIQDELHTALREIRAGRPYFSPEIREAVQRMRRDPNAFSKILSDRELEMLPYLGFGLSDAEIRRYVYLSTATIKTHRQRIMAKLGVHHREDLMRWAAQKGFCDLSRPSPSCVHL